MRRILSFVTACLFLVPSFTLAATPISSGDLIKASGPTVYYYGEDGKRYVFPTEKTYFSWYTDFSAVKTVSDSELASYPLGGNVTYRPGTRLVKITTDPKVYAVDKKGTLRWMENETIAKTLYGADWAKKVDDLPDAFFINYVIGAAVVTTADFIPVTATNDATSINADKGLTTTPPIVVVPIIPPPAPEQIYAIGVVTSNSSPRMNDYIEFTATASPSADLMSIAISVDERLSQTCSVANCVMLYRVPESGTLTHAIRTVASWTNGKHVETNSTLTVRPPNNEGVTLTLSRAEVKPNGLRDFYVFVDSQKFSPLTTDIYVDNKIVYSCSDVTECRYTDNERSEIGTVHPVYAVVKNNANESRITPAQTITVVEIPRPVITTRVGMKLIAINETVDIAVESSDMTGVSWTEIWLDNVLLKHCEGNACTLIAGPWSASRAVNFVAKAQNTLGLTAEATAATVTVQ
ncbi:MAG: hypothetical protein Q7R83_02465 [bacterium]|nr:hypothetical protein [bacterium]